MVRYIVYVQANQRDAANAALESKGFGPNNFSIPLVPETQAGEPPASHYSCNWQFKNEGEQQQVAAILSGVATVNWDLLSSPDPAIAQPTFEQAITARGRKKMIQDDAA